MGRTIAELLAGSRLPDSDTPALDTELLLAHVLPAAPIAKLGLICTAAVDPCQAKHS